MPFRRSLTLTSSTQRTGRPTSNPSGLFQVRGLVTRNDALTVGAGPLDLESRGRQTLRPSSGVLDTSAPSGAGWPTFLRNPQAKLLPYTALIVVVGSRAWGSASWESTDQTARSAVVRHNRQLEDREEGDEPPSVQFPSNERRRWCTRLVEKHLIPRLRKAQSQGASERARRNLTLHR
jgi:hypothetical protein